MFLVFPSCFCLSLCVLDKDNQPTDNSCEFQRIVACPTTTEILQELSNRRYACPLVQLCGRQVQLRRRWLEVQARQASTSTRAACLQTNPTTAITTASSDVIECFAYIPFCYKYKLRKFCVSGWFALLPIEHMPFVGLHKPQGQGHSWKNTRTAQTRLCYFSGLLCHFFASWHAIIFLFAFCCENWHIRWMNRHPLSLKQTCCQW